MSITPSSFHPEHVKKNLLPSDPLSIKLFTLAKVGILALVTLLPIFFIPTTAETLGIAKSALSLILITIVLTLLVVIGLRTREVVFSLPLALVVGWLFVLLSFVSAVLSGDVQDALRGSFFEVTTTGFSFLFLLVVTVVMSVQGSIRTYIATLGFFGISAVLLLLYSAVRFVLGAEFLSFNSFKSIADTPIGTINDLAVLSGVIITVVLMTMLRLPINVWLLRAGMAIVILSLFVLATINFTAILTVVAIFATLIFLYSLVHDRFDSDFESSRQTVKEEKPSGYLIISCLAVCLISWLLVASPYLSQKFSQLIAVDYLEVRPAVGTTVSIAKGVYEEDLLFGIGPNRFADAWRMHKDPIINQTPYWGVDFSSGYGYVPTIFVTNGLLGGVVLVLFHALFIFFGLRVLLVTDNKHSIWYYINLTSFSVTCFILLSSYFYLPSAGVLLLGAVFMGITLVSVPALMPRYVKRIALTKSKARFVLFGLVSVSVLLFLFVVSLAVAKQGWAQYLSIVAVETDLSVYERTNLIQEAKLLYNDSRFSNLQAQILLSDLNRLLALSDPAPADQQAFVATANSALLLSNEAVDLDQTNPANHLILALVHGARSRAGITTSLGEVEPAIQRAYELDPFNPVYYMLIAQLKMGVEDYESARLSIDKALSLKPDYTEALNLSTQLSVLLGEIEVAIEKTLSAISIQPQNPTLIYQLGVLYVANNDSDSAIEAFRVAVERDPQYANARYLLALEYIKQSQPEMALAQLYEVKKTNEDNSELIQLINNIESGQLIDLPNDGVVNESSMGSSAETINTDEYVPNDLLSPVNRPVGTERSTGSAVVNSNEQSGSASTSLDQVEVNVDTVGDSTVE